MAEFISEKTRRKIVADISKNLSRIKSLWLKAVWYYEQSQKSIGKKRLEGDDKQRHYRNLILDIALSHYHSKDPKHDERNGIISESYSEFWDFLGFWLDDVKINYKKWNEMEDYHFQIMKEFPEEMELRVKKWKLKNA